MKEEKDNIVNYNFLPWSESWKSVRKDFILWKKDSRDIRNLVDFNSTDFAIDNFKILIDQDQCKWSKLQTSYSASIIQEFQ